MKLRVGLGLGAWPFPHRGAEAVLEMVERCEALGIDSLWFSDRIVSPGLTLEPVSLISFIAARATNMKFGTSALVLPIRNPVVLAKELATLDYLSGGRLLLVVGLGSDESQDLEASGIPRRERAGRADEAITLMRLLWSGEPVTYKGAFYSVQEATVQPRPVQQPGPPMWIGGRSDAALRRVGRLGDGWLVSAATAEEVGRGIQAIREYASSYGREIPEDHYGAYLSFCFADSPQEAERLAENGLVRRRSDVPPSQFCAFGTPEDVRARVKEYFAAGATKFVMRPSCPAELWYDQLEMLAREVVHPLQTPFSAEELVERRGVGGPVQ